MRKAFALAVTLCAALATSVGFVPDTTDEGYILAPGGVRLFYRVVGVGTDTVVVLHGGPGGHIGTISPDVVKLLARHRVLFYDQRGGGMSGLPQDTAELRVEDHVRDLDTVRRYFGLQRMTLIGHEWGAGLATQYAAAHPDEVGRMLLISPLPARASHWQAFQQAVDTRLGGDVARRDALRLALRGADPVPACRELHTLMAGALFADRTRATLQRGSDCSVRAEAQRYAATHTVPAAWRSLGAWDWRNALGSVRAPTLIVRGERDLLNAESVAELALAFPDARVLEIPGAGHYPHVEAADRFWAAATPFINGTWPADAVAPARVVAGN